MKAIMKALKSIADIKAKNRQIGHHWFDADTLRFFDSKIYPRLYHVTEGAYFVTSERGPDLVRKYTVRFAKSSGKIETVGEFQQYATHDGANEAAKNYARLIGAR